MKKPPASFENLSKLTYTKAVFEEALRLYPPAVGIYRLCNQDTKLAGISIRKGDKILINIGNIQRHPQLWPRAE